jgi:hypothetical protein
MACSVQGRPKKARQEKNKVKSILIIFFVIKKNVHKELVLAGKTVNSAYYCEFYSNYMKTCKDFAPNFGDKRIGCCIMTMHSLTLPLSPGNSSPKTTWLS